MKGSLVVSCYNGKGTIEKIVEAVGNFFTQFLAVMGFTASKIFKHQQYHCGSAHTLLRSSGGDDEGGVVLVGCQKLSDECHSERSET
jgi:hypothetical protein